MEDPDLAEAVEAALAAWESTGCVAFLRAAPRALAQDVDISVGWRRGHHDRCEPFGIGPARAHAGGVGEAGFVHFDADRDWDAATLERIALHEFGHALGLGHGDGPGSLLVADPGEEARALSPWELHGLHSLYGGGVDRPGDLVVSGGTRLRQVAPVGASDFAVFDTDLDGDDEVVVWRTDRGGHGTVIAYHFAPSPGGGQPGGDAAPRLVATTGPRIGMTGVGAEVRFAEGRGEAGPVGLLVSVWPDGREDARAFDGSPPPAGFQGTSRAPVRSGDLDGDGRVETVSRP